ncbi:hypothetical protein AAHC03_04989 [Spirometra sp. Aus1]
MTMSWFLSAPARRLPILANRLSVATGCVYSVFHQQTAGYCMNFDPPTRKNEDIKTKRSRLLYESRKRGNLENGILLATFADKYLAGMNELELEAYDNLINKPDNDWDIYYWATGNQEAPQEFQTDVLKLLQEHARNPGRELRNQLPPLRPLDK